jgi:hypothetical protein
VRLWSLWAASLLASVGTALACDRGAEDISTFQGGAGVVKGTVRDPEGQPVPGAVVTVSPAYGPVFAHGSSTIADSHGSFVVLVFYDTGVPSDRPLGYRDSSVRTMVTVAPTRQQPLRWDSVGVMVRFLFDLAPGVNLDTTRLAIQLRAP